MFRTRGVGLGQDGSGQNCAMNLEGRTVFKVLSVVSPHTHTPTPSISLPSRSWHGDQEQSFCRAKRERAREAKTQGWVIAGEEAHVSVGFNWLTIQPRATRSRTDSLRKGKFLDSLSLAKAVAHWKKHSGYIFFPICTYLYLSHILS